MAASRDSQHPGKGPAGAGTPAPVAAKAAAINAAQAHPLTWKTLVKRALVVAVAGAGIYLALPSLIAVLGAALATGLLLAPATPGPAATPAARWRATPESLA